MANARNRGLRISRSDFLAQMRWAHTILFSSPLTIPETADFLDYLLAAEEYASARREPGDYGNAAFAVLHSAGLSRVTPAMLEYAIAQLHAKGETPDVCAFLSSAAEDIREAS